VIFSAAATSCRLLRGFSPAGLLGGASAVAPAVRGPSVARRTAAASEPVPVAQQVVQHHSQHVLALVLLLLVLGGTERCWRSLAGCHANA
jgi:hypothetical protein